MNERHVCPVSIDFDDAERDTLSTRFEIEAIVDILKTRFSDYSESASALAPLSPALDFETLREILKLAGRASTFKIFCEELDALWASRDPQTKAIDEEQTRELATAQLFNNFVVGILEKRRRIGAAFLRRYVGEISPKVAQTLDFDAYSTEPTVHVFGAQVARLCDLIFSIPFKDRSKGALAVAVPMEHKSTQTRNVVFQLLTSLVLVLQYILRHKERYQRNDKKFVWPFLLLFYTGARPWKKVLNFPDLFATPDPELDKRWIFKLPFKFARLFGRRKRRAESDPWLEAFLELTKAAERIVAKKDATPEDWKQAWNDALKILEGNFDPTDEEEPEVFGEFFIFISKVSIRQGWIPPTRETIDQKMEELGGVDMDFEINSFYDLGRYWGVKEGKEEGKKEGKKEGKEEGMKEGKEEGMKEGKREAVRDMLKRCLNIRFPLVSQSALNNILSISDVGVLETIFSVACASDSFDNFQRDVRRIIPAC